MQNYLSKLCFCMDIFAYIMKATKPFPEKYTYIQFCVLFNKVQAQPKESWIPGLRITLYFTDK